MSSGYTRKKIEDYSYGLNDVIGKGYSSQVYKGRNDQTMESVAVKVIDMKMLKNEINRVLLESEIQILKEIKLLPNVLRLHDVYTTKNNTYIITELCESDLSKVIKRQLTEPEVFSFMKQIINGYMQFYRKMIIHRDLKPANILITEQNQLKIADFGFGIKAEEVVKPSKYNVGSPLYMAPESLKRNQYSFKTDIWSLGIIFYQMLTCDTPWKAKNQKDLIRKIESQKIQELLSRKNMSTLAKDFLMKTLKNDKNLRMSPSQLEEFDFGTANSGNILMQKKLNLTIKPAKQNPLTTLLASPKINYDRSIENRQVSKDSSDKKFISFRHDHSVHQNVHQNSQPKSFLSKTVSPMLTPELKRRETAEERKQNPQSVQTLKNEQSHMSKQQKKSVSKMLIAEVHFCRFLFKLLNRINQSKRQGLLQNIGEVQHDAINKSYTGIIKHKIQNLMSLESSNFIKIDSYTDYKKTEDFRKLMKISKEYKDRYCSELANYWGSSDYIVSAAETSSMMNVIYNALDQAVRLMQDPEEQIRAYSKDIIILDYLMTCRQLIEMIQDGEDYQKFARKSRIQEIVEGKTAQINFGLYLKIMSRAKDLLQSEQSHFTFAWELKHQEVVQV